MNLPRSWGCNFHLLNIGKMFGAFGEGTYSSAGPSQRGPVEVQAQIAPRGGNPGALRAIVEKVEKEDERVSSANVQNSPHILAKILFLLHFLLLFHFILLSCKKPSNGLQVSDGYLIV